MRVLVLVVGVALAAALPKPESSVLAKEEQSEQTERLAKDLAQDKIDTDIADASTLWSQILSLSSSSNAECKSDNDCPGKGQPNFGEDLKSYCVRSTCSRWKAGHPLGADGYPVRTHDCMPDA